MTKAMERLTSQSPPAGAVAVAGGSELLKPAASVSKFLWACNAVVEGLLGYLDKFEHLLVDAEGPEGRAEGGSRCIYGSAIREALASIHGEAANAALAKEFAGHADAVAKSACCREQGLGFTGELAMTALEDMIRLMQSAASSASVSAPPSPSVGARARSGGAGVESLEEAQRLLSGMGIN